MIEELLRVVITIAVWELFAKDFITWEGFGTPFRRKNRNAPGRTVDNG